MTAERARRRFTAEEVLRMVETGILREDEPLELIDGQLVAVSPQGPRHRALTTIVHTCLERSFGAGFTSRTIPPSTRAPRTCPNRTSRWCAGRRAT